MNFDNYIKSLRSLGRYSFTGDEAIKDLGISKNALNCAVYRLKKKNEIITPLKNLYVIVPPEYQFIGCLPAEELVPIVMGHMKLTYYVSLLSAAYYHGASHQKAQVFQVMTNKRLKNIRCGKIHIEFLYKKKLTSFDAENRVVKTGYLVVASPELTIKDLLSYVRKAGGLNSIATILSELIEAVHVDRLLALIHHDTEHACWQRLGWILEHLDVMNVSKRDEIISALSHYAKTERLFWIPLAAELPIKGMPRNELWKVIENTTIEGDV